MASVLAFACAENWAKQERIDLSENLDVQTSEINREELTQLF